MIWVIALLSFLLVAYLKLFGFPEMGDSRFPCGRKDCPAEGTKQCSRCKEVHYCSKEHKVEDWKRHRKTCGKKVSPESANKVSPEFACTPNFREEYRASYPADRDGFSTLLSAFMGIQMKNSPLQQEYSIWMEEESILDPFGTAGRILAKRWDCDLTFEPGIPDFLKREKPSPGEIWRNLPRLARSILSPMALDIFLVEQ